MATLDRDILMMSLNSIIDFFEQNKVEQNKKGKKTIHLNKKQMVTLKFIPGLEKTDNGFTHRGYSLEAKQ